MVFAEKTDKTVDTVDLAARSASLASPASDTLEKRQDIQGWSCSTQCWWNSTLPQPNTSNCKGLTSALYGTTGLFTVSQRTYGTLALDRLNEVNCTRSSICINQGISSSYLDNYLVFWSGDCSIALINSSGQSISAYIYITIKCCLVIC
jgi:hypothetical protein